MTERRSSYGSPVKNFDDIAKGWSVIFGVEVTARDVGLAMIWLKITRDVTTPMDDNLLDMAGYVDCIDQIVQGSL